MTEGFSARVQQVGVLFFPPPTRCCCVLNPCYLTPPIPRDPTDTNHQGPPNRRTLLVPTQLIPLAIVRSLFGPDPTHVEGGGNNNTIKLLTNFGYTICQDWSANLYDQFLTEFLMNE